MDESLKNAPYRDPSLPVKERVEDLLSRMTLREKLEQLCSDMAMKLMFTPVEKMKETLAKDHSHGLGRYTQYSAVGLMSVENIVNFTNTLQKYYCEETRLGIPVMLQSENLCGYPGSGGTIFPAMLGVAATFDEALVEEMGEVIGKETKAVGISHALSPVLDLAQDPRWGRVYETFGEDPYLVSQMGKAYVKGMQSQGVGTTGKHFLGYSVTQAGLNTAVTRIGDRELYDHFATPFEAAIQDSGMAAIMTSYSEIDGIPCGANKKIARELLREKMGFEGLVLSDGGAVWKIFDTYHVSKTYEEAGLMAIKGGIETEMPVGDSFRKLDEYVEKGELDVALIDDAVRHVLETKFATGLFENPYVDAEQAAAMMMSERAVLLSEKTAEESITLLENQDHVLPLKEGITLAVIGPHGNLVRPGVSGYTLPAYFEMTMGMGRGKQKDVSFHGMLDEQKKAEEGYTGKMEMKDMLSPDFSVEKLLRANCGGTTLVQELKKAYQVEAALGCDIIGTDTDGFAEAVACAEKADLVILTLGGNCGWIGTTGGEGKDRMGFGLPGVQQQLLEKVASTGKDIVLVLYGPAGYAPELPENVKAVLYAWLPGPFGGKAVANVLRGVAEPQGRLPITLPRNAGQVPIYYYHKPASGYMNRPMAKGAQGAAPGSGFGGEIFQGGYTDGPATPLYPFGYGLGYTQFEIGNLQAEVENVATDGVIRLNCDVENTGERAGMHVVQLYFHDVEAHVTRPAKQLCAYARVALEPSRKARVCFEINTSQLGFTNEDDLFVVEPGTMRFLVGPDSMRVSDSVDVELVGSVQNVRGKRSYTAKTMIQ